LDEIAGALGVDKETASAGLADADRTVASFDGSMAEFLMADDGASPEGELLLSERTAFLRAAVASLPEKMRYIVEQVYFEDRSVKEVAEELGYTHSAVSQQRGEAIRLLHDGLKTHYTDDSDKACEPESRLSPVRRKAYLEALASETMGGIARAARSMPSLEPAL
jgi:RNA polymerase sigma factor for flagellar operon FliA